MLFEGVQVNFNTEIWLAAPLVWRLDRKEEVVMIVTVHDGPVRHDYDALFPGRTVTTGIGWLHRTWLFPTD